MNQPVGVPFLDLKAQYEPLKEQVQIAFNEILNNTSYIMGREVTMFEADFAKFCHTKYAVGVANGTDALVLALRALGIGVNDEVITAANTFIATCEAISLVGAIPVLVDCDSNYNLDVNQLASVITDKTKAIIPVHLYGRPANLAAVCAFAKQHQLFVIEDASQAHGATFKGQPVGGFGDIGCFSFYPGKNLGAYGDAGGIVTNNEHLYATICKLRNHGSIKKYHHDLIGYNSRLDTLQAAVLQIKLGHLKTWNASRQSHAALYQKLLCDVSGIILPPQDDDTYNSVHHLFVIRVLNQQRDALQEHLGKQGIGTGIHYPIPVHLSLAYRELGFNKGTFSNTENQAHEILSLPMFAELTQEQIHTVTDAIKLFFVGAK